MNIVEKNINDIKPYENNPRKNDIAVKPVANSIREFGFKVPIVIDKDGIIIAGHTRYRAAKELKLTKVPCIIADDLSDQQVKAFRLADNKVSEFAEWDQDALLEELQGILAVDMSEFGFIDEDEDLNEPDDTYTTDINIPQYEPTGEVVSLENCLDDNKTEALLMEIEDSNVTEKEKDFLRKAAQRHNQFNYKRIAEYYANASEEMQELMERSAVLEVFGADEEITAMSAAALSNKLQQLANGAVYDDERNVHEIHDCKIGAFMELIEQLHGKPALVFYNFKHDCARLKEALAKTDLRVRELKGADEEFDWNAGKIDVLLAHPASTAYGLNLQDGGNHVIWFGLNWSLELYQQANKRLHRQGQNEKVIIHHLISVGTRDEDMMEALEKKDEAQEYVLQSLKARIDKYVKG